MDNNLRWIANPIQIYAIEQIRNDEDFSPASGSELIQYVLNGKTIRAHTSYYKQLLTGDNILIRAAEHGTSISRWLKRKNNPQKSLQNVSIVFSETTPSSNTDTDVDTFFIVEQYYYIVHSITKKDVDRIISQIKKIQNGEDAEKVFVDPLKNNARKKAGVQILRPYKDGKPTDVPTSGVNQRQLDIVNGKIKITEARLRQIIKEAIEKVLNHKK